MAAGFVEMQRVLAYVSAHLDSDISLAALASRSGLSRFHLQRVFSNAVGESPKHLTFRLRLGRAAVLLLTTKQSILDIALATGFGSHETFTRAFERQFKMTPRQYRKRGFAQKLAAYQTRDHAELVDNLAPCVGLYHIQQETQSKGNDMTYSVTRKELTPQPVLVVRRKVKRSAIAATIGEALPLVFAFAQQHGIAFAGPPLTRYVEMDFGMVTMEPGMPIAGGLSNSASIEPGIIADMLPGGPVASTLHIGPYESLTDAYAAIQQWIETQGLAAAGAPWESYLTDPGENPDPATWKTEIFWPVKPSSK